MDDHAIVVADTRGIIQLWSPGAAKLFGHPAAEVIGRPLDVIVPEEYRAAHGNCFSKAMTTGEAPGAGQAFELPIHCAGGVCVFPGMFTLVRDAKQAVIGAMAIFTAPVPAASG